MGLRNLINAFDNPPAKTQGTKTFVTSLRVTKSE